MKLPFPPIGHRRNILSKNVRSEIGKKKERGIIPFPPVFKTNLLNHHDDNFNDSFYDLFCNFLFHFYTGFAHPTPKF